MFIMMGCSQIISNLMKHIYSVQRDEWFGRCLFSVSSILFYSTKILVGYGKRPKGYWNCIALRNCINSSCNRKFSGPK